MDNSPAPGWYTDPYNADYIRWWDGQAWGENIYPAPIKSPIPVEDSNSFPFPSSTATQPVGFTFSAPELAYEEHSTAEVDYMGYEETIPETVQQVDEYVAPAVYNSQDVMLPISAYKRSGDVKKDSVLVSTDPTDFVNDTEGLLIARKKKRMKNLRVAALAVLIFAAGGIAVYFLTPIISQYLNR